MVFPGSGSVSVLVHRVEGGKFAGVASISTPPARNDPGQNGPYSIFFKKVKGCSVILHTDDEVDAAVCDVLDVGLAPGIRLENVGTDVQTAPVHTARSRGFLLRSA